MLRQVMPPMLRTSIIREGNEYVITGRKWFITNAPYERTKIFIVMGKSDADNPKPTPAAESDFSA